MITKNEAAKELAEAVRVFVVDTTEEPLPWFVGVQEALAAYDAAPSDVAWADDRLEKVREFTELEWQPSVTQRGSTPRDTFLAIQRHLSEILGDTA